LKVRYSRRARSLKIVVSAEDVFFSLPSLFKDRRCCFFENLGTLSSSPATYEMGTSTSRCSFSRLLFKTSGSDSPPESDATSSIERESFPVGQAKMHRGVPRLFCNGAPPEIEMRTPTRRIFRASADKQGPTPPLYNPFPTCLPASPRGSLEVEPLPSTLRFRRRSGAEIMRPLRRISPLLKILSNGGNLLLDAQLGFFRSKSKNLWIQTQLLLFFTG